MPLLTALLACTPDPPEPAEPADTAATAPTDPVTDTSTPATTSPDTTPDDDLLTTCAAQLRVAHGTLCALQPSVLDPAARDVAGTAPGDDALGFGWHLVGIPDAPDPTADLWIHFVGTYARPYDPRLAAAHSPAWLDDLLATGATVVVPAYDNRRAVNDDCAPGSPGYDHDDCAGEIREEVLTGADVSPYRDTPPADSVDQRLAALLRHLANHGAPLPDDLAPEALDWSRLRVAGSSQGGNLAYYVAHERGVRFACLLSSPYDHADSVDPSFPAIADWFEDGTPRTPPEQLGQLVATEDDSYDAFWLAGSLVLGLTEGVQAFRVTAAPYHDETGAEIDAHPAVAADPALAPDRAAACLR
ncbi:MAG: hypothetical protein R3F59_18360 [Myxococcota bacterium]